MARHSEIPNGYEMKGELKEIEYRSRRNYSPQQIADRIKNPSGSRQYYESQAKLYHSMAEVADNDYKKSSMYEKKAKTYELLAKKTKIREGSAEHSDNEGAAGKLGAELEKLLKEWKKADKLKAATAIVGLAGGLVFLSPALTGYTIADIAVSNTNIFSTFLFAIGFVSAFLYLTGKKKR